MNKEICTLAMLAEVFLRKLGWYVYVSERMAQMEIKQINCGCY